MEGWVEESRRAAEITEIIKVSIMTEKSRSDYAMLLSYYRRLINEFAKIVVYCCLERERYIILVKGNIKFNFELAMILYRRSSHQLLQVETLKVDTLTFNCMFRTKDRGKRDFSS